jgi:threonylcarbamoyladenosine tRNA methylthiotransferase MtaB
MKELTAASGLENAVVVNTCAVTAEAVRQSRQSIRKLRRENPELQIIVTGCAAKLNLKLLPRWKRLIWFLATLKK